MQYAPLPAFLQSIIFPEKWECRSSKWDGVPLCTFAARRREIPYCYGQLGVERERCDAER